MPLLDENGAATRALYNGIGGIAAGLVEIIAGLCGATIWHFEPAWAAPGLILLGVGLTAWAIVSMVREAKRTSPSRDEGEEGHGSDGQRR